jgi:hypothetical protein
MVTLQESRAGSEIPMRSDIPITKQLDEAVWRAWILKGRARDARSNLGHKKALKWISITALFGAAALWSYLAPYQVAVGFFVAASSMVVMFQAFQARRYILAAAFAALVLLYNPVVPAISLLGDWQRVMFVASAVPFVASLASEHRVAKP